MYLIDTNIHSAFLLQSYEDDETTRLYLDFFNKSLLSQRLVPDFILNELEILMIQVVPSRYQLNQSDKQKLKNLTFDYIRELTTNCILVVPTVNIVKQARDLYLKNINTHYISFTDSLLLATAKQNSYTLLTKDQRIIDRAKEEKIKFVAV